MKKIFTISLFALMFFALAGVASAKVERVAGSWELDAPSGIDFVCGGGTYSHTLDSIDNDAGKFDGNGTWNNNDSYTWDIDGIIDGATIEFTIVYTGSNDGYTLNGVGTIDEDGSIIGTTNGNCQTFSMGEGSAVMFTGNHGQYVRSQEDKHGAAHSRIGMPAHSKGHKK